MSTPFNAAAAAYGNASRLITERAGGQAVSVPAPSGENFGQLLAQQLDGVAQAGRASEALAMDMVNGRANVVDVVTALSQTEIAMETMVTVRDRVIAAYEEIMRMPI